MTNARFTEVEAERIVLREPNGGRVRATLECAPPRGPDASRTAVVRLTLFAPDGEPALVAEVDELGQPFLYVGNPDGGPSVVVGLDAVDIWQLGNVCASLRVADAGGKLELMDAAGKTVTEIPKAD